MCYVLNFWCGYLYVMDLSVKVVVFVFCVDVLIFAVNLLFVALDCFAVSIVLVMVIVLFVS